MNSLEKPNITLIGMPGSGKSTLGPLLAKALKWAFIDTDALIIQSQGMPLQTIIQTESMEALRQYEAQSITQLDVNQYVIATGGSAVYSKDAMSHLKSMSVVVYIELELSDVLARVNNIETRGLVRLPTQDLSALYLERKPLYERYADIRLLGANDSPKRLCSRLIAQLNAYLSDKT